MNKPKRMGNYKGRVAGPPELVKDKLFLIKLTERDHKLLFEYTKSAKDFTGGSVSDYWRSRIMEIVKRGK
jgi:hypothetical protein